MKVKRIFTMLAMLMLVVLTTMAQTRDEVTLTVAGEGVTKEEATKSALRDAISQTFGTFVSSNTQLLNDELVKDEIVSVTSGNVKNYKEISCVSIQGKMVVTLQATVCISKLVSYAKSKGSSAELAGATFAMNMKMKELNKQNEYEALRNLVAQLIRYGNVFNYKLSIGEPRIYDNDNYGVDAEIHLLFTDKLRSFNEIIFKTMSALSLSKREKEEYENVGLKVYEYRLPTPRDNSNPGELKVEGSCANCKFYFRNDYDGSLNDDTNILNLGLTNKFLFGSYSPFVKINGYGQGLFGLIGYILDTYSKSYAIRNNLGTELQLADFGMQLCNYGPWMYYLTPNRRVPINRMTADDWYPTYQYQANGTEVACMNMVILIPKTDIAKYSRFYVVPKDKKFN